MWTYAEIDRMLLEADVIVEELFAQLEKEMMGDRVNIPVELMEGGGNGNTQANVPYPQG